MRNYLADINADMEESSVAISASAVFSRTRSAATGRAGVARQLPQLRLRPQVVGRSLEAPWPQSPLPDVMDWVYSGNRSHPTEKAVEIITPLVERFSRPGGLVLDPFLGSGTTAVAAALAGRGYIGVELEERYCTLARNRLSGVERFHAKTTASGGRLLAI